MILTLDELTKRFDKAAQIELQLKRNYPSLPVAKVGDKFKVIDISHKTMIKVVHIPQLIAVTILGDDELQRYFKFATITK